MHFTPEQRERLERLGDVKIYNDLPVSPEEWVERTKYAEIICSGKSGLTEKIYEHKNVFYSLPFVAVGWINKEKLKENNITVSYCPGCNSYAVSEWIVAMTLLLMRKFRNLIGAQSLNDKTGSPDYHGLAEKKACILGKGNVGSKVRKAYEAMGMKVSFFERGDKLIEKIKNCDIVVNTLSSNEQTEGLLGQEFYDTFDGKTYFITVTSSKIYNPELMLKALKENKLLGIADDCGSAAPGDYNDQYYQKLLRVPGIIATPHISYQSDVSVRMSNDMMIDNVEAWIKGEPINVL